MRVTDRRNRHIRTAVNNNEILQLAYL